MKLLTNLRLMNWHYFSNVAVPFSTINFLTGENAAGKSTLIDAMQVLLLGDTSGRSFNKAANEKAGRTLKGYLRGEIGDDGESAKYLRTGRFSSYIAMEFQDDVKLQSFVLGIVFDVFDDGSEEHKFFYLQDAIPAHNFLSLNAPMTYKQLLENFAQNYRVEEFRFFDSNAQYQQFLKEAFGGIKDKYFSLFKKAVSFTPITNIEQFITEYVCDVPQEINVASMRENIQQYKRLEIEAHHMEEKVNRLEEIQRIYSDVQKRRDELKLASYISKRVTYQVHLNTVEQLQNDLKVNQQRLKEIDVEIGQMDLTAQDFTHQKEVLIASKISSNSYQLTLDLSTTRDKAKERITTLEHQVDALQQRLQRYLSSFEATIPAVQDCLIKLNTGTFSEEKERFSELETACKQLKDALRIFREALQQEVELNGQKLKDVKEAMVNFKQVASEQNGYFKTLLAQMIARHTQEKQQMQEGSSSSGKYYDYQVTQIRSLLQHALSDHFHEPVEVAIFADLMDIRNPRWSQAIEGFIFNQKINFFVEDRYYEAASKMLAEIMRKQNYYRLGVVDAAALIRQNFTSDAQSLAEEILTDHAGAKSYATFLLGRMIKCETFQEARACGRGITPKCEGYRNFASFVIPEKNYLYPVIGRKVSVEQKGERLKAVEKQSAIVDQLRQLVDLLSSIHRLEVINEHECDSAIRLLDDAAQLSQLKANLLRYEAELASSTSQEVTLLEEKIHALEKDIAQLQEEKQSLLLRKGQLIESSKMIEQERIPQQLESIHQLMEEIEKNFEQTFLQEVALPTFQSEMDAGKSLSAIRLEYDEMFTKAQNKLRSIVSLFQELRKDYIVSYKLSYDITKEDNEDFDRELYQLKEVRLPEYRAKIQDAYQKATKEFKDDFIFKLKTAIESVRTQIDELNEALKDAQFGQDSYQFTVTPAPQYREYYEMITDELLLSYGEDETLYLNKYQDIMNNLFKMIGDVSGSRDQNALLEENVVKFTDYRTYLLFDLMVKKGENKPYSLARNIKKASGGETQTPFYISILASFSQLYRVSASSSLSNTVRLVVFDEAFSKMDRSRIMESIRILKMFGLQVILSAPPEKVSDISKLVNQTLLVSRSKNRSYVDAFSIDANEKQEA